MKPRIESKSILKFKLQAETVPMRIEKYKHAKNPKAGFRILYARLRLTILIILENG